MQRRAGGVIRVTAVPYHRGQWEPVWRAFGTVSLRRTKVLRLGTGMLAPPPAQLAACCRTSPWRRACSPLLPPANASAGPCRAQTNWVAVLPGALRVLACGRQWKRGGAIAEEASSVVVLETGSSVSQPCSGAPASAFPLAATLWSCPASPSAASAPLPSQAWRYPPLNPLPHLPSTSHTNRFASLSHVGPRLPVPPIRPRSWSAAADKGALLAVALSRASSMTRRSAWSGEGQPTRKSRGLPWTWPRWHRLVFKSGPIARPPLKLVLFPYSTIGEISSFHIGEKKKSAEVVPWFVLSPHMPQSVSTGIVIKWRWAFIHAGVFWVTFHFVGVYFLRKWRMWAKEICWFS